REGGGGWAWGRTHVRQIGVAIAATRGRANRDEYHAGLADRVSDAGRELESPVADVRGQERLEPRFIDWHFATPQRSDFFIVLVDAGDLMSEVSQASPGDQPNIAGADHSNMHGSVPCLRG